VTSKNKNDIKKSGNGRPDLSQVTNATFCIEGLLFMAQDVGGARLLFAFRAFGEGDGFIHFSEYVRISSCKGE
jgi:hypothetical protein